VTSTPSQPAPFRAAARALAAFCFAGAASAEQAAFLRTDLSIGSGEIVSIDGSWLTVEDPSGSAGRVPLDRIDRVDVRNAGHRPPPETGRYFVDLVDGQRLIVDVSESPDPESLTGRAAGLGPVSIPIERIRLVSAAAPEQHAPPPAADRVTLLNGDVLTGFVASLGAEVVIESDSGATTTIGLARARSIELANPPEPPARDAVFVSDTSGSVIIAREFSVGPDLTFTVETDAAALGVASNGAERVAYKPEHARFVSLSVRRVASSIVGIGDLQPDSVEPTGGRRWTPDPVNAAPDTPPRIADVFLPAPAAVRFELPRGAVRFATGVSHRGGPWTDCTASVFVETRAGVRVGLGQRRITSESEPAEPIEAELPADAVAIVFEVDPGRYGAIQDAVVFVKPRVVVRD